MFCHWIVAVKEIWLPSKSNPPKMRETLNMLRPIVNRSKWHLKNRVVLNTSIKMIYDSENVVVAEANPVYIHRSVCVRELALFHSNPIPSTEIENVRMTKINFASMAASSKNQKVCDFVAMLYLTCNI